MNTNFRQEGDNDIIDVLLYPLMGRLAQYIPSRITPNQLTVTGFICGMVSAFSLLFLPYRTGCLFAAIFIVAWWVFDSLDGIHARLTRQTSEFGGFLDHFFDIIFDTFFMFSLLIHFNIMTPLFVIIVLFRSASCSIAFLSLTHTHTWRLPVIGPLFEKFIYVIALVSSFLWPGEISLMHFTKNEHLAHLLTWADLDRISIIGLILLSYFLILPYMWITEFMHTKKCILSAKKSLP